MKAKTILLALSLFSAISGKLKAQEVAPQNLFAGLQNTFTNTFTDNPILTEAVRWGMLFKSDIQIYMNGNFDEDKIGSEKGFWIRTDTFSAAIDGMFDWDNGATTLFVKSSNHSTAFGMGGIAFGGDTKEEQAHRQFIDKEGYWYVPFEVKKNRFTFIKVNAKQTAVGVFNELLDLSVGLTAIDAVNVLLALIKAVDLEKLKEGDQDEVKQFFQGDKTIGELAEEGRDLNAALQEKLKNSIKAVLTKRFSKIKGFPVFIHWAFLYSPAYIRARYHVKETKLYKDGVPNGNLKLTVDSGEEKGKSMIFDRHNRLLYIDTNGEGTAFFVYDRDVTVTLPEAYTMEDIMSGKVILPN